MRRIHVLRQPYVMKQPLVERQPHVEAIGSDWGQPKSKGFRTRRSKTEEKRGEEL